METVNVFIQKQVDKTHKSAEAVSLNFQDFFDDHVTLQTGVMMLKRHRNKLHFKVQGFFIRHIINYTGYNQK